MKKALEIDGCLCAGTGGLGVPRPLLEPGSSSSSCPKHCQHLSALCGARTGHSDEWTEGAGARRCWQLSLEEEQRGV